MTSYNPGSEIVAKLLPVASIGVEIGVFNGHSSARFLPRCRRLHLVDPWSLDAYPDQQDYLTRYAHHIGGNTVEAARRYFDRQHSSVVRRFTGQPVTVHRMTSAQFFATFMGEVDWVYIDGLHDYESVRADLLGAAGIVKPGGVIYGDDYGKKPGVAPAVDEFAPHRELLGLSQYRIQC